MARALILDYNGVVVNDEPIHMAAFQRVLGEEGIPLSKSEYFSRYLGLSDRDIALDSLKRRGGPRREVEPEGRPADLADDQESRVEHLLARKALAYRDLVRRDLPECEGAAAFIREAANRFPIAVASGALRVEVEDGLYRLGVRDAVTTVVTIEDVARGKPHPEIFLRAKKILIQICTTPGTRHILDPDEASRSFLVVEDSPAGLAAARAAWMPAVGVTTSRPAEEMKPADLVISDLSGLDLSTVERL